MIYVVKKGDTLFGIAKSYTGDGNRYRELLPINPQITDPNYIEIGDMINIPDSWSGGSSNVPAVIPPGATGVPTSGPNVNNMVIVGAIVVLAAAGAYWYLGRNKTVAANPEDEGDEE